MARSFCVSWRPPPARCCSATSSIEWRTDGPAALATSTWRRTGEGLWRRGGLNHASQARVGCSAGDAASFCDRFACDLLDVGSESYGRRSGDRHADAVGVYWRLGGFELADALDSEPAGHVDPDALAAGQVESRPHFVDEVDSHLSPLFRGVETHSAQPVAERLRDPQRFLGLILERVDEDDA